MYSLHWQSVVDFLVLATAFYLLLVWAKQARAVRIALGILGLHVGALIAHQYDLYITSWVLEIAGFAAIGLLFVVFQAELRRAVMRIDSLLRISPEGLNVLTPSYRAISTAAFALARDRVGALIVLVRKDSINELVDGGVELGAELSAEILEAVFQKQSPLHDGAAIVEGGRITRVNGVLPLTQRTHVPGFFGTRHRAAMGLAERSDALVVAVSEQRGQVTLFRRQDIHWVRDPDELVKMIRELHTGGREKIAPRLRRLLFTNIPFKLTALGLASLVWGLSFFLTGTTVRTVAVPVEFSNVPAGMSISGQTVTLEVQVRGSPWLMESFNPDTLVAHFDLGNSKAGTVKLQVQPNNLDLPPGVVMEKVTPKSFSIRVTRQSP